MQEKLENDVIAFFSIFYYCHLYHALVRRRDVDQSVISQLEYDKLWLINQLILIWFENFKVVCFGC